ncbi:MAG: amidophosphoribosyltransferase [Gammaproteobacteria bacterium]|nr:MAG: amidophosphoribosyltransferase [Gammaproteobacteria bacterium]
MCGIVGIVGQEPVNQRIYDALTVLQHRGQDAAGIVAYNNGHLALRKSNGLVRDVFATRHMRRLAGNSGIGHVRYPTAGSSSTAEAQPIYVNSPYGITLAHNGNLTNAEELVDELFISDKRHINTASDSEVLLNVFAHELDQCTHQQMVPEDIFKAVAAVHRRCRGGYAAVAVINGHGMVCFRDPYGIRPVIFGKRQTLKGTEYMVASESVALDTLGFEVVRDVAPGEAIYIDFEGNFFSQSCADKAQYSPCIFEHVYFARPDSVIDKISVYKARLRMGEKLADKILKEWPDHDIDVVIPIPDSSFTSAVALAHILQKKMRHGLVKNRYIGRTFIMPGQQMRRKSVRQKLNPIGLEFKGKNVLLVDDSIVRGTTSEQIIQMARDAGAKKVYFASAAPPVRYPNVYGIDMPSANELIAHGKDVPEIQKAIAADWLIFQDLEDLIESAKEGNPDIDLFDTSVFNGHYVTGDIDQAYLDNLQAKRNDYAKQNTDTLAIESQIDSDSVIGLHNTH